jgi:hypothetical protein
LQPWFHLARLMQGMMAPSPSRTSQVACVRSPLTIAAIPPSQG